MKKNNLWILLCITVLTLAMFATACTKRHDPNILYYTCPMHPQIKKDAPGQCPICGMTLVPVKKEMEGHTEKPVGVLISPERLAILGVETIAAQKKSLTRDIRTSATIADSPELATAQEEYLSALRLYGNSRHEFVTATYNKLKLMGMSDDWIRNLRRRGKPESELYLQKRGGKLIVAAALYEYQIPHIQIGQNATVIYPNAKPGEYMGKIIGIEPRVDPKTRTARAWIEVLGNHSPVPSGSYLIAQLQEQLGTHLTVPKTAVLDTGRRQIVIVKNGDYYEQRDVQVGEASNDDVAIESGLEVGEDVVVKANFFIDSEAQLKAQLNTPEHQH
ncbi:MAG: hypothetical protein COV45_07865 [Deltaproteobacteria bacterium CG11_big_fil_rev_8_21_14_0_20_47_16]|nr:MAG: hypothetical protein COV45_07865 [Deltaproteobacteria bacterium CG11_big_fil_rev_8_21_14_0_20_47_16]